jgi:DNA-binding XRE family transcriptional regulator
MQLNDFLEKLPLNQRASSVLVCEVDYSGLRAAVVARNGDNVAVTLETSSDNPDYKLAVAEVVAYMRKQGWTGKLAALLTPSVMTAMIELPIPPKNKLAPAQLAESINWELEPLIAQHLSTLSIGKFFVLLGYLSPDQVEDVVSQQAFINSSANQSETFTYKRFGEVAVDIHYITQAQLDMGLERLAWFQALGDEIKCGWAAQAASVSGDKGGNAQYQWLACAINQTLLRQWQAAFTAQGLKLENLYPLAGCAIANVDMAQKVGKQQLLLEVYDSVIAGVHITGNRIKSLYVQANTLPDTLANLTQIYHTLEDTEFDTISYVSSSTHNEIELSQITANFERISQQALKTLAKPTHFASLGMLGAARHIMRMKGAHMIAGVPVSNPQPSLTQRLGVRAALAGMALLLAIGVAELVMQIRQSMIETESEKVNKELKTINDAIARLQAKVDEVNKTKDAIKALQEDKKEAELAVSLLSVDLPKRNQTVVSVLSELAKSVSDDVVIDRIAEDPIYGFSINAWALNEKSAQEFIKIFQVAVHPLGYKLKDITVATQTGRLGLLGYSVIFSATALDDVAWNANKQTLGRAAPASATPNPTGAK